MIIERVQTGMWSIDHIGIFGGLFLEFRGDKDCQFVQIILLSTVGIEGRNTELHGENNTACFLWVNSLSGFGYTRLVVPMLGWHWHWEWYDFNHWLGN